MKNVRQLGKGGRRYYIGSEGGKRDRDRRVREKKKQHDGDLGRRRDSSSQEQT